MWHRYLGYADAAYATLVNNWYHSMMAAGRGCDSGRPPTRCMRSLISPCCALWAVEDIFATMFQRNRDTNFAYDSTDSQWPFCEPKQTVFDDEAWWALAWLATYDLLTSPGVVDVWGLAGTYLEMAKTIFNNMSSQWTWRCGGGLCWTRRTTPAGSVAL